MCTFEEGMTIRLVFMLRENLQICTFVEGGGYGVNENKKMFMHRRIYIFIH